MSPIVWMVSARLRSLLLETLVGRAITIVQTQARITAGREKRNISEEGQQVYKSETRAVRGAQKAEKGGNVETRYRQFPGFKK